MCGAKKARKDFHGFNLVFLKTISRKTKILAFSSVATSHRVFIPLTCLTYGTFLKIRSSGKKHGSIRRDVMISLLHKQLQNITELGIA
jgi:hypothetical protein